MKSKNKNKPPFPLATATWMIKNTTLTFAQIAEFCDLHSADVANIGGRDSLTNTMPVNPVGIYVTKEEIERCEKDETQSLQPMESFISKMGIKKQKEKKYVSVSQKRERLDAALWLTSFHKKLTDTQISKLVGSTKSTVEKIRNGIHREIESLVPKSPVIVGLCSKKDLDILLESAEGLVPKKATKVRLVKTKIEKKSVNKTKKA